MEEHQKENVIFGKSPHSSPCHGQTLGTTQSRSCSQMQQLSVDFWSLFIILRRLLQLTLAFLLLHGGLAEVQTELELEYLFLSFY